MSIDSTSLHRRKLLILGGGSAIAAALGDWTSAAAAEPFKIGALNPITGGGSPYGTGMQKSIIFAAEEVNEAGGAAGRLFKVFAEDDETNADAGVRAAKKLIGVNNVDAVIGLWSSPVGLAIMPFLMDENKIFMNTSGATAFTRERKKDLEWRFQPDSFHWGYAYANTAKAVGAKRAATMALNNPSAVDGIDGFTKRWKEWGQEVVARVVYEPNRVSYRSELQAVLASKPDIIVLHSFLPDTTILLREWFEMGGTNRWVISGFGANPQLVSALGADVTQGILSIAPTPDESSPAFKRFAQKYKAVVGKDVGDNNYAAGCYDMVIVLALAIELSGASADNLKIVSNIRKVANEPGTKVSSFAEGKKLIQAGQKIVYQGAFGILNFDESGDPSPGFVVSEIVKGKFEKRWTFS